jgi:hypothetical protein
LLQVSRTALSQLYQKRIILSAVEPFKMASPASSSGEEPKKNLEQITFRFCSEW